MANTFKNASVEVGTTATTLYTCPGGTTAIVHNLHIGNKSVSNVTVNIDFFDSSAVATRNLGSNIPIPVGGALEFDKPINLEAGDQIRLTASDANRAVGFGSVLEIT